MRWLAVVLVPCAAMAMAAAPLVWREPVEVAVGGGERGPWQQNDSRSDFVDDPTVAIDERGDVVVAWVDQKRKDVFVQRIGDGPPVNVSRSPATFSWLPRIVVAPGDPRSVAVLWQEIIFSGGSHGGEILFARSGDGGRTFSEPLNLSRSVAGDGKGRISRDVWHNGSLDLVAAASGPLHATWTEYEGALWVTRSTDGGKTFAASRRVAGDDARPARAPSLAVGASGTVFLAWTIGMDESADVRVARSTDGGVSFGEPRIAASTPGYSDAPKVAVDARGALHLVYGEDTRVWYTRSTDGAQTFDRPRPISGRGGGFPALALDGNGHVYALWERFPSGARRPRGLELAVSRDGGQRFTPGTEVPRSADRGWNGSSQGLLMKKLAVGADGAIAIVNSALAPGTRSRVWLMRATAGDRRRE